MTETVIVYERGSYWVCRDRRAKQYTVYRQGVTHSRSDSSYPLTGAGLSIAIARCNYLDARMTDALRAPRGWQGRTEVSE